MHHPRAVGRKKKKFLRVITNKHQFLDKLSYSKLICADEKADAATLCESCLITRLIFKPGSSLGQGRLLVSAQPRDCKPGPRLPFQLMREPKLNLESLYLTWAAAGAALAINSRIAISDLQGRVRF